MHEHLIFSYDSPCQIDRAFVVVGGSYGEYTPHCRGVNTYDCLGFPNAQLTLKGYAYDA